MIERDDWADVRDDLEDILQDWYGDDLIEW